MRLLWIEDGDTESLEDNLFKDFKGFLDIPSSYDDALKKINNSKNDYDFIIIDIDLTSWEFKNEELKKAFRDYKLSVESFRKEAGFHLFIKLILQGFNKDRIIFLTGNVSNRSVFNQISDFLEDLESEDIENDDSKYNDFIDRLQDFLNYFTDQVSEEVNTIFENGESVSSKLVDFFNALKEKEKGKIQSNAKLNTYDEFEKIFGNARIPIARSYNKTDTNGFNKWLTDNLTNNKKKNGRYDYIVFRRGVIEAVKFLQTTGYSNFTDNLHRGNKGNSEFLQLYFKDYLNSLLLFLPHDKPSGNLDYLSLFINSTFSIFESLKGYTSINVENLFIKNCLKLSKVTRNLLAHDKIARDLTEQDVAYLFIIAMRAIFDINEGMTKYEEILLSIFDNNDKIVFENLSKKLSEVNLSLDENVGKILDYKNNKDKFIIDDYKINKDNTFLELIDIYSYEERKTFRKDSMKLLYQHFWFSFFDIKLGLKENKRRVKSKTSTFKANNLKIDFDKQIPIVKELGKAIYNLSFK